MNNHPWKYTSFLKMEMAKRNIYIHIYHVIFLRKSSLSDGLVNPSASHRQRSCSRRIPMEQLFPLKAR